MSRRAALLCLIALALASCKNSQGERAENSVAKDFDVHECAACGMIVREQPAPRAQLVHKDGTRHFFCSVSDMATYLTAPSPHGPVTKTWVETMDTVASPLEFDTAKLSWINAADASYVVGIDKKRVMGTPVLVYSSNGKAQQMTKQHGGKAASWADLRSTLTRGH